ncbi:MAG: RNA methyltransferase [bacterium]
MRKLTHKELLDQRQTSEDALKSTRHPISIVLDNIRSSYNVGSVFRSSDSALVEEVLLCGFTPAPPRKEVHKTALGADESVPWRYFATTLEAIEYKKKQGSKIVALELTENAKGYSDLSKEDFPLCIVVGNEISGISDEVLALCDFAIEIPMYGVKHSLNVSVSAGIAIYEAVRIWKSF